MPKRRRSYVLTDVRAVLQANYFQIQRALNEALQEPSVQDRTVSRVRLKRCFLSMKPGSHFATLRRDTSSAPQASALSRRSSSISTPRFSFISISSL